MQSDCNAVDWAQETHQHVLLGLILGVGVVIEAALGVRVCRHLILVPPQRLLRTAQRHCSAMTARTLLGRRSMYAATPGCVVTKAPHEHGLLAPDMQSF